jgi:two-component system NarL family sensor kinase
MAKLKKENKTKAGQASGGDGGLSVNFLEEKDVFKILLSQMQNQLVQIKEQEIAIIKEKTLALLEGEEKERVRISSEIHDGIGQMLTAIKLVANSIKGQDELKVELKKMIDDTISEARRVSFNLMPSVLLNFGLVPSVKILCENAEKYAGLKINQSFSEDEALKNISFEKAVILYRLIQEALNNILKHANAKNIFMQIENNAQLINVLIEDDGEGFEMSKSKNTINTGKGLSNMYQRAELSGGKCSIESRPGKGTKINFVIPL